MEQKRGQLTERIKARSFELLGREISQDELRLFPYIQYVMANGGRFERKKMKPSEVIILNGYFESGDMISETFLNGVQIKKEFYLKICEIIFLGYVDLFEAPEDKQ